MHAPRMILAFALLVAPAGVAAKDAFRMRAPAADAVVEPQIIGGRLAVRADWPATFIFEKQKGVGSCTSTAVGSRVILTAAHCVDNGAEGEIERPGGNVGVLCEHHSDYTPSDNHPTRTTSADWALCLAKSDLKVREYETLNKNAVLLKKDLEVLLTGYGCNKQGGSDGGFGALYEGEANVQELPNPNHPERWKRHYAVTRGGAAVCYGDSGGATYLFRDAAKQSRVVVGVNSRGDISTVSYISAASVDAFSSWAKKWADQRGVTICGLHPNAASCHP